MSDYLQQSFAGGMNLLSYDTRIGNNQYVVGFNLRNRNDVLEPVKSSERDVAAPTGIKQEIVTFGNYVILFVAGLAYYRYYTSTGWKPVEGFLMSVDAPRFWTCFVPVTITNYSRFAIVNTDTTEVAANGGITLNGVAAAMAGNNPGLLVQDNINQPQFIFLNSSGIPTTRVTQTYAQWTQTDNKREYVPIGNSMAWVDGRLYITSPDFNFIYPSVSGRPLDFVIAVDENGDKAGDATATSYSVGVGGISCIRQLSTSALFVAASNSNFVVTKNMTQNAPTLFGEYTFIRTFLFNATCLSDRCIIDSLGDTRFIDLTGVRSFNAIEQEQNEGRNSQFSLTIQKAFKNITQDASLSASILYDNYEFYAMDTIFGPSLIIYDTINKCWSSFDTQQTNGKRIKQLAKIELTIQRLYAVTEDDQLYTLYIGDTFNTPKFRPISASANLIRDERGYGVSPKGEIKLTALRTVFDNITEDIAVMATPYVNNRLTESQPQTKQISYSAPVTPSLENQDDIDTQLTNAYFTFPDCGQGWKTFTLIEWTGDAVLSQFIYEFSDLTPQNPLTSQNK